MASNYGHIVEEALEKGNFNVHESKDRICSQQREWLPQLTIPNVLRICALLFIGGLFLYGKARPGVANEWLQPRDKTFALVIEAKPDRTTSYVYVFSGYEPYLLLEDVYEETVEQGLEQLIIQPETVKAVIQLLCDTAAKVIHPSKRVGTPVSIKLTAPETIPEDKQDEVLAKVKWQVDTVLKDSPFIFEPFVDGKVMTEREDAIHSWVGLNYMLGRYGLPDNETASLVYTGRYNQMYTIYSVTKEEAEAKWIEKEVLRLEPTVAGQKHLVHVQLHKHFGLVRSRLALLRNPIATTNDGFHNCMPEGYEGGCVFQKIGPEGSHDPEEVRWGGSCKAISPVGGCGTGMCMDMHDDGVYHLKGPKQGYSHGAEGRLGSNWVDCRDAATYSLKMSRECLEDKHGDCGMHGHQFIPYKPANRGPLYALGPSGGLHRKPQEAHARLIEKDPLQDEGKLQWGHAPQGWWGALRKGLGLSGGRHTGTRDLTVTMDEVAEAGRTVCSMPYADLRRVYKGMDGQEVAYLCTDLAMQHAMLTTGLKLPGDLPVHLLEEPVRFRGRYHPEGWFQQIHHPGGIELWEEWNSGQHQPVTDNLEHSHVANKQTWWHKPRSRKGPPPSTSSLVALGMALERLEALNYRNRIASPPPPSPPPQPPLWTGAHYDKYGNPIGSVETTVIHPGDVVFKRDEKPSQPVWKKKHQERFTIKN